jgi:hydroxyacylglutathione hydrolase
MNNNYYLHYISSEYTLLQIDVRNALRNYNYVLHNKVNGVTIAIDPTDASITCAALEHHDWKLQQIWLTHHHNDHIGGCAGLMQQYDCDIVGNIADAHRLPPLTHPITISEFTWQGLMVNVLSLDGHTVGHIGYHLPELNLLFAGDVIFSLGCGRIFEGSYTQAWESLQKIASLPPKTMLCIAHEYTLDNANFAVQVDAENVLLQQRFKEVQKLRAKLQPTVPTLLELELATNPFLHANNVPLFTQLRLLKDNFNRA